MTRQILVASLLSAFAICAAPRPAQAAPQFENGTPVMVEKTSPNNEVTEGSAEQGLSIDFKVEAADCDAGDLTYTWHFGDGETATGKDVTHTYNDDGSYSPYVVVRNEETTNEK